MFSNNSLFAGSTSNEGLFNRVSGTSSGGALSIISSSLIVISGSNFTSNSAQGGMTFSSNNYAIGGSALGGAVALLSELSENIIIDCHFTNNIAKAGNGTIDNFGKPPNDGLAKGGAIWLHSGTMNNTSSAMNGCDGGLWGTAAGGFLYSSFSNCSSISSIYDWANGFNTMGGSIWSSSLSLSNSSISNTSTNLFLYYKEVYMEE